ncbi:unnamed protein product [Cochlearia groenlandica]
MDEKQVNDVRDECHTMDDPDVNDAGDEHVDDELEFVTMSHLKNVLTHQMLKGVHQMLKTYIVHEKMMSNSQ